MKYVAWIDHDLIFDSPDWISKVTQYLSEGGQVCQLFSTLSYLDNQKRELSRRSGTVAYLAGHRIDGEPHSPGGAWAGRIDYLMNLGGLHEVDIVGGGDQVACDAWTHRDSGYIDKNPPALAESCREWVEKARASLIQSAGFIEAHVSHLYHGDKSKRQYDSRMEILHRFEFNPTLDLLRENGAWTIYKKPKLSQALRDYFSGREDDV
ncbi:hypothetical protein [Thalassoglobus neptunius]|uniref:hypothetical protein n=1 Tax=Thalassoglobus neptunius TaxID=1938619 RepID=UPI0011B64EC8|nr:hypothetical protein [Thalassoglobus neptunius]